MTGDQAWKFCEQILPEVSRSFALIIPQCPPPINSGLCVAYLICRLADTVEDEPGLEAAGRDRLYDTLLRAVDAPVEAGRAEAFVRAWPRMPEGSYGKLVRGTTDVLTAFASLPAELHAPIRQCVHEMIEGMSRTVPVETRGGIKFMCHDLSELDQYCHYVAGTVGIMSTAIFAARFDPTTFTATDEWREQGRRLGLGLQMTNIIKDCGVDARRGVSFVPAAYVDMEDGDYRLRPGGRAELIRHTIGHLDAALGYVLAVPPAETGIRTFLLGSMLPAIATLEAAAPGDRLQPKIERALMVEILTLIGEHVADDATLVAWYDGRRNSTLALLE